MKLIQEKEIRIFGVKVYYSKESIIMESADVNTIEVMNEQWSGAKELLERIKKETIRINNKIK